VGNEAGGAVVDAGGPVHHLVRRVAHLGMGAAGDGDGARALGFGSAIRTKRDGMERRFLPKP